MYQALGYEVYLITQFTNTCHVHYATRFMGDEMCVRGLSLKAIGIIDEYDVRLPLFNDLLKELESRHIPYVGFAK